MSTQYRINKILSHLQSNLCSKNENIYEGKVAVIMGAGNGLGASIAKLFASKGFIVMVARRNKDKIKPLVEEINAMGNGKCYGFGVDSRKEDKIIEWISYIENNYGAIEFAVFNPGANVRYNICETTSRVYYKVWEMACFGGFLFGKEIAKYMEKRGRGCMIFSGATASVRGKEGFAAFSGGKQALRALAQSMAKELGPKNIHIAHIIIDGGIDSEFQRNLWRKTGRKLDKTNMLLKPDEIAKNYWNIYTQHQSAWTFEMDLRPYCEKWT